MPITTLLVNHMQNPLGFELSAVPRLSWIPESTGGEDTLSRVEVAFDEGFTKTLWDSGLRPDNNNICCPIPFTEWSPRTRYFWRVTMGKGGKRQVSETAWFETGKLNEPWQAQWISPDFKADWHPVLFTDFELTKKVSRARIYITGLGLYQLRLNGDKVGDEELSPGLCAYDKWIPYQTYDITSHLKDGKNSVEVLLGNGWYKGRYGLVREKTFHYGEEFLCIGEVHITYDDGTEDVLGTNPATWRARRSAYTASGIFDGESRDDTLDTQAVYPVKAPAIKPAALEARRSPGIKIMLRLKPEEIIRTPAGEIVLDMGQNMVGWLEFTNHAPKGAELYLQFGEVLQQGNFYRDNLRTALSEYHYISDGKEKKITQLFTFHGFRYVKLTKWEGPVNLEDFTGLVLYSQMTPTGTITTGSEKVNKLFQNTIWGQRGNYLDVPTDCPQRDERMGWTGDAEMFFGTAAFNFDVNPFFHKYCYDLYQEQRAQNGNVPVVIPKHDFFQLGSCAWGDAATIIPWNMYVMYGDKAILEQQFESMKAWVDYIRRRDEETGGFYLWRGDYHCGDWLSLDVEDSIGNRFGGTEHTYLASCYYRYSALLTAKAARVLGKNAEAGYYQKLSDDVRDAIVREYVTPGGRLAVNTQTAYILALFMDIIPEEWREKTACALRMKLKESNYHLRTGFIGTPFLCRVLSENGSNDIAYRLLLQEDFPSWLYEVNMGATTVWERWNSIYPDGTISDTGMNSLNHYAYGSIVEWLYRNAAGINPVEDYPGFRRFRLVPRSNKLLKKIAVEFNSPAGLIRSSWEYLDNGKLEVCCTVPPGAVAEFVLPDSNDTTVKELKAGEHFYQYIPESEKKPRFNADTPVSEMYRYPAVAAVLEAEFPSLTGMMCFSELAGERSLNDFAREGYISLTPARAEAVSLRLSEAGKGRG
ncbi:MAG: glycoside hydrolase family 78 protein [Spirochaetaceae bacterium]|jgi:alpha-L-rhamnosidase|nr:glycoside hydrolase family 78 protein [Spirochaetaceae bacterium]